MGCKMGCEGGGGGGGEILITFHVGKNPQSFHVQKFIKYTKHSICIQNNYANIIHLFIAFFTRTRGDYIHSCTQLFNMLNIRWTWHAWPLKLLLNVAAHWGRGNLPTRQWSRQWGFWHIIRSVILYTAVKIWTPEGYKRAGYIRDIRLCLITEEGVILIRGGSRIFRTLVKMLWRHRWRKTWWRHLTWRHLMSAW
jgi:hypothetical protein